MAVYKISDLLNSLSSASVDGYEYVDISSDSEDDESLLFSYENAYDSEDEFIDSISTSFSDVPSTDEYNPHDICPLMFTNDEVQDLSNGISNVINVFKDSPKNKNLDRDTRDNIKKSLVAWRNLDAKFEHFFKKTMK